MDCICLLTHDFKDEFINTLVKIDRDPNIKKFKVIVLFDTNNEYNISNQFENIDILK